MGEEVDAEIDDILKEQAALPGQQTPVQKDAFVMEDIPPNEVYVVPSPEPPEPLLISSKLHRSLGRTRTWLRTLAILSCCIYGVGLLAAFVIGMNNNSIGPVHVVVGMIIVLVSVIPLAFMMVYANRIEDFNFQLSGKAFLKVVSAQCMMWTILGIYTWLVFLLGIAALATLFFAGFAMKASG